MNKDKPLEELKKVIKNCEKQRQKDIDDTKDSLLKQFKQDLKDLSDVAHKLNYFRVVYGIDVELVFPNYDRFTESLFKELK